MSGCGGKESTRSRTDTIIATSEEPGGAAARPWSGTFTSTSKRLFDGGAHGICSDGWKGTLHVVVDGDGRVTGNGRADLTSPPKCPNTAQGFLFKVSGTAGAGFRLRLTWTGTVPERGSSPTGMATLMMHGRLSEIPGGPVLVIPKTGECQAKGDLATSATIFDGGGPDANTVHTRIELTCG